MPDLEQIATKIATRNHTVKMIWGYSRKRTRIWTRQSSQHSDLLVRLLTPVSLCHSRAMVINSISYVEKLENRTCIEYKYKEARRECEKEDLEEAEQQNLKPYC